MGFISGSSVRKENAWHPMIKNNYLAEESIKGSGVPYTMFRPTFFMDTLPRFYMKDKVRLFGKQPQLWSWVFSGDLARMVLKAFSLEQSKNKSFTIFGPEKFTMEQAAMIYCRINHTDVKSVKHVSFWIGSIMALIIGKPEFKNFVLMFKYFEKQGQEGDPAEENEMLGAPQTTVEKFSKSIQDI